MAGPEPGFASPHDDSSMGLSFREEVWLRTRPLSVETVLEYFRLSPWFDSNSINARAIAQGLSPDAARRLKGIEYRVAPQATQAQGLIVLEAWERDGPGDDDVRLAALYYSLYGTIFQAPDVRSVIAARARRACDLVRRATATVTEAAAELAAFDAGAGRKREREEAGAAEEEEDDMGSSLPLGLEPAGPVGASAAVLDACIASATEEELGNIVAARNRWRGAHASLTAAGGAGGAV